MALRFALNRMAAPRIPFGAFCAMAQRLGASAIEIRNDLVGVELEDGTPGRVVGAIARDHGLVIRSINALQRFEQYDAVRDAQAQALLDYAADCGAQALVLCPTNSLHDARPALQRHEDLVHALAALAPKLKARGLLGLVEPLGFGECAVRCKSQAVRAMRSLGDGAPLALVHDTFHHHLAGEDAVFPELTGLVHVSGVDDASLDVTHLRDGHRVLVGESDRLGNVRQLHRLLTGGYGGYVSFEPFADAIARADDIEERLADSMQYLQRALNAPDIVH